jgi:hypothetical protein
VRRDDGDDGDDGDGGDDGKEGDDRDDRAAAPIGGGGCAGRKRKVMVIRPVDGAAAEGAAAEGAAAAAAAPAGPRAAVAAPGQAPGVLYALPRIPYLRLRFGLRAERAATLPRYHGSLLRGAFGHALRLAACAMGPSQPCVTCRLRRACVYTRLFETFVEDEPPPFLHGLPTSPRPYVFEPLGAASAVAAGGLLEFDLLLIGQAVDLQAYVLLAVERMAERGLGRDRHRFKLEGVRYLDPSGRWREAYAPGGVGARTGAASLLPPGAAGVGAGVGVGAEGRAEGAAAGVAAAVEAPVAAESAPGRATLRFVTPTRIKVHDHLVPAIGVRPLVFAMLRRTLELAHFHVPGAAIDWTFRALLDHASSVEVCGSRLRWYDWERYSSRQKTKMSLGGFVGTLEIAGDLGPLWALLRTAEILHVGKGATFGLGRFEISGEGAAEVGGGGG